MEALKVYGILGIFLLISLAAGFLLFMFVFNTWT